MEATLTLKRYIRTEIVIHLGVQQEIILVYTELQLLFTYLSSHSNDIHDWFSGQGGC